MDKETIERITAPYEFREFPKMLYHPDGRTAVVADDSEQSALGGEWAPNPEAALKTRAQRDAAEATKAARAIGVEAAARGKNPER